jgi:Short C-terminal domain
MFRRRRPLLRAAAVGGTAYVAGRHMGRAAEQRSDMEAEQDQRISDLEQQQAAPTQYQQPQAQPPAPAPAAGPSMTDQLNQLTTLHQQGALTDEEFAAAKAKLLGS